jgi:hypothetical protein
MLHDLAILEHGDLSAGGIGMHQHRTVDALVIVPAGPTARPSSPTRGAIGPRRR